MTAYPFVRSVLDRLNVFRRLTTLENGMTFIDDALADLDQATNDIAGVLDEALETIQNFDTATAEKIRTASTRLRGLAADRNNPVPAPDNPPLRTNQDPEPGTDPAAGDQQA